VEVIEAFNIPVCLEGASGSKRHSVENTLQLIANEKNRTSQVFCLFLANNAYSLFLDDEKKIRNEAMRVCSALLIHRQQFTRDLFSQRGSRKGIDIDDPEHRSGPDLHEGFLKLIPHTVGGTSMYATLLRRINPNFEDEDKRIAEFSFWLTDNGALCDQLFNSLDLGAVVSNPAHLLSTSNSIKDLICEKVKVSSMNISQEQQGGSISEDVLNSQFDYICEEERQWLVYGMSEVAGGALQWKDVWFCQQSCPVWGNAPTTPGNTVYAIGGNEDSYELTFTPYEGGSASGGGNCSSDMSWRLSSIGGPEKVCRRIEQDYETPPRVGRLRWGHLWMLCGHTCRGPRLARGMIGS
jgi:hypothetical protein